MHQPKLLNVEDKIPKLKDYFATQKDILAVWLFGSYGTEFQTPRSDIDFAILFADTPDWQRECNVTAELSALIAFEDVDLVNLHKVSLRLQHRVLREGRLIYEKDYITTCDYMEKVIKYYCDREPAYRRFDADFDAGLKEDYGINGG